MSGIIAFLGSFIFAKQLKFILKLAIIFSVFILIVVCDISFISGKSVQIVFTEMSDAFQQESLLKYIETNTHGVVATLAMIICIILFII